VPEPGLKDEATRKPPVPRSLRWGSGILAALGLLALAAPLLATDRPWLARGESGYVWPAFGSRSRAGPGDRAHHVLIPAPVPYAPESIDLDAVLASPSRTHWIGTDELGRDTLARLLHGGRVSIGVGLLAAMLALLVGLPLGSLAGYRGKLTDAVVSRGIEAALCFPTVLLALALLATAPAWIQALPDSWRVALVLGVAGWTPVARYLRGEFLRLKTSEMVAAARASGAGDLRVMGRHILPAAMAPVLVTASFSVAAAILLEGALSYLGLGVRPPTPTWGGMLKVASDHLDRAWWLALFPGMALFLVVLGCNLLGEGLRDWLDPRSKRTE
jgi:peptide/nickel transport system permease protein